MQDTTSSKSLQPGEVILRDFGGLIKVYAFNEKHIGTLVGICYEKVQPILRMPEASFALTQAEYSAILEAGAEFIRIVAPGRSGTYSISLEDFGRYGVPYDNSVYGAQLRVSLDHFAFSSKTAKRNTHTDNPKRPTSGPIAQREKSSQWDRLLDR